MVHISRLFTKTEYTVAYRISDGGLLNDTSSPFRFLELSDSDRWYADPFICKYNDEYYVFMEVFVKSKGYAGIGYSKLVNGELTIPEIVIDAGYHMSFPSVCEFNGNLIMIPETCAKNNIQVFRCVNFPEKWVAESVIAEDDGYYDSVLFVDGEKYKMFTSTPTEDMYGSRLFILELEQNGNSLKMKDKKEITSDYRISREAGFNIISDGKLYRVAQDCSNLDYGHALEFVQVENTDIADYSEKLSREITVSDIRTVKKVSGKSGVHTYNRVDNFEVIDLKLCTFSLKNTILKIKIVLGVILDKLKNNSSIIG